MIDIAILKKARLSKDVRYDGKFFIGAKTTKIFCRNVCPVKPPKEENVEYFYLAAQAINAGYRPCLRCRPESAPNSYAWQGVDTTLIRALALLRDNFDLDLLKISDKLGISDRYLRKLFQEKLGISPKQFQLTEQLLFAKKLLHQTALSIEQIALTIGFQSSRRLQDNFRKFFKLSPSEIRRNNDAKNQQYIELQLSYTEPYNWERMRDFLERRAIQDVEFIGKDSYGSNFQWLDTYGYFEATFTPKNRCFNIKIYANQFDKLYNILQNIRRVFDLDVDTNFVSQQLKQTGLSADVLISGLRLPGVWSVFEAGCRAIMGQQVSVTAAINHLSLFVNKIGNEQNGRLFFPTAIQVLNTDLNFLKMPKARIQTLHVFAEMMSGREAQLNPEEWAKIRGIGPWTIAYAKMRGLSDPDIWLDSDLVIKKMLSRYKLNSNEATAWRSYLTLQLWSML